MLIPTLYYYHFYQIINLITRDRICKKQLLLYKKLFPTPSKVLKKYDDINNQDNTAENTQASESRIRDTDMEKEILEQSAQAMFAQANQSPQGVLSLLQQ